MLLAIPLQAQAANQFPDQTKSGSVGLQGVISAPPPTKGATITSPGNGSTFTAVPITVTGLCPNGLLVKIFANNVFVGSEQCTNGSYSIPVTLFNGQNDLVARVYDALDQAGPDSNVVTVTFRDAQFLEFGTRVQLTSNYAERGAPPNQEINWPIILSGGTGPYAVVVDWGDGSPTTLVSLTAQGTFNVKHAYRTAGVYKIIVKATDKNGSEAFLQLVGVATGAVQSTATSTKSGNNTVKIVDVLWWPAVAMVPLLFGSFWVGRRYELYVLRKQLERSRDRYSQ